MLRTFLVSPFAVCVYLGVILVNFNIVYLLIRKKGRRAKFYNLLLSNRYGVAVDRACFLVSCAHSSGLTILLIKKEKRNGQLNVGEHCQEEEESGE